MAVGPSRVKSHGGRTEVESHRNRLGKSLFYNVMHRRCRVLPHVIRDDGGKEIERDRTERAVESSAQEHHRCVTNLNTRRIKQDAEIPASKEPAGA